MKKKSILITGMNAAQVKKDYFLGQELQVVPSQYSVIRCLEDLGYEVDQRPIILGEDLSEYDDVIVYIHSIQSFCQRLWGGLYAIAARPDCIIAFDDWQVNQIYNSIETYKRDLKEKDDVAFRQYLFDLWQGKETPDVVKSYKQMYIEACDIIAAKNNRLLVSAFDGGDLGLLNLQWNEDRIFRFNPNPFHLNRKKDNGYGTGSAALEGLFGDEDEEKLFEWNFASLVQEKTRKWLAAQNPDGWKWPIKIYGGRRGKFKSERLTESEMVKTFKTQWGILMPGYFHSGSGWWRARPLQVADVGSILIGEPEELMVYYKDETLSSYRAEDIEAMDITQLQLVAEGQKEAIYSNHPLNKEITKNEIREILNASK